MDVEHWRSFEIGFVLFGMNTIDRTRINTSSVFRPNARFTNDVCHETTSAAGELCEYRDILNIYLSVFSAQNQRHSRRAQRTGINPTISESENGCRSLM